MGRRLGSPTARAGRLGVLALHAAGLAYAIE